MRISMVLLVAMFSPGILAQNELKGLKQVKSDLRPIVGAHYRFTPPGPDWFFQKKSIPGPPAERTEMFLRRDRKGDGLCTTDELTIEESWVDAAFLGSDSSMLGWFQHSRLKLPDEYTVMRTEVLSEPRYGAERGFRWYLRGKRMVNGVVYEMQVNFYAFKYPAACFWPSLATGFVSVCRVGMLTYVREDQAGTGPDLSEAVPIFDGFSTRSWP